MLGWCGNIADQLTMKVVSGYEDDLGCHYPLDLGSSELRSLRGIASCTRIDRKVLLRQSRAYRQGQLCNAMISNGVRLAYDA